MATVTKPIALDESINTTEQTPRNIADVLAEELARIAGNILPPNASQIAYDNTASGLIATNVQDAIDEIISSQADVIADTMADLTENKTATVTDGVADFETIDGSLVKSLIVEIEPNPSGYTQEDVTVKGRNLLETPYYQGTSYTTNGVTFTENADGTVTANGTASANTFYRLMSVLNPSNRLLDYLSGKTVSGSPSGGSTSKYLMQMVIDRNVVIVREYGDSEVIPDLSQYYGAEEIYFAVSVRSGYTATNLIFKPMITVSGGTYANYEPYHGKTYTTTFGQSITAGGTLNFLTGELTTGGSTISLTPQTVKALVGENHIQASTGDVTECKFSMMINGDDLEMLLS